MLTINAYKPGDVVTLVTMNGAELIGEFVSEDTTSVRLRNPQALVADEKGVAFQPLLVTSDADELTIGRATLMVFPARSSEAAATGFQRATSAIARV